MSWNTVAFDAVVKALEQAWRRAGEHGREPPSLETFWDRIGPLDARMREPIATELALVDMEFRWQLRTDAQIDDDLGSRPTWRRYAEVYPAELILNDVGVAAIAEEYRVRWRWGDRPSHSEFSIAYPHDGLAEYLDRIDDELRADAVILGDGPADREEMAARCTKIHHREIVLTSLIGQGGMGKVYRALHKPSGRFVAVKALRKDRQTDPMAVDAFARESEIVARLDHPNIVRVWGVGRFPAGGRFIVLDLVEGTDLQTRMRGGPLNVAEVVRIGIQIAEAVAHAHDAGIIHCDLKPANVLIDADGHAFVSDFGFAQLVRQRDARQPPTVAGGTRGYAAPELFEGSGRLYPTADVYSLGATLFALLCGGPPEETPSGRAEQKRRSNGGDARIWAVIERCMQPTPECRCATGAEAAELLRRIR